MRAILIAALVLGAWPAAASASERTIFVQHQPTEIRAYAGMAIFSRWDGNNFALVLSRSAGAPEVLPVPPQRRAFDADIGPDATGRPTVVLSRCDGTRACRLYRLRIGSAAPERIPIAGGPARIVHPSLWRDRIAWVRADARTPARVFTRRLSATAATELPGVPARGEVEELELYGSRVALSTVAEPEDGGGVCGQREVRLVDLASRRVRRVGAQLCGLNGQSWVGPSFAGGGLYFARFCAQEPVGCGTGPYGAFRYRLRTGDYALARFGRALAGWAYDDAGRAYEVRDPTNECVRTDLDIPPCSIVRVSGLRFAPARPPVHR
jgi:hypothetical protein